MNKRINFLFRRSYFAGVFRSANGPLSRRPRRRSGTSRPSSRNTSRRRTTRTSGSRNSPSPCRPGHSGSSPSSRRWPSSKSSASDPSKPIPARPWARIPERQVRPQYDRRADGQGQGQAQGSRRYPLRLRRRRHRQDRREHAQGLRLRPENGHPDDRLRARRTTTSPCSKNWSRNTTSRSPSTTIPRRPNTTCPKPSSTTSRARTRGSAPAPTTAIGCAA